MMSRIQWLPAGVLFAGAIATSGVSLQRSLPLRAPLGSAIPAEIEGVAGSDVTLSDDERLAAGVTAYLMRSFFNVQAADTTRFSLYIGYYDHQVQGHTIHSPKNCLPGGGWEALASETAAIGTAAGPVVVNRYLLQFRQDRALVLYWYQGRGRVQASEYGVKLNLLRDAALRHRSEEALVRIIVPVTSSEEQAFGLAARAARTVLPALATALPD